MSTVSAGEDVSVLPSLGNVAAVMSALGSAGSAFNRVVLAASI